jgi:putative nucleotidyltransferase with HDIG domain
VLLAFDVQEPALEHWPIYALALAAQLGADALAAIAWVWACQGVAPRAMVGDLRMVYRVDVLLAPVGLLAALAAVGEPVLALLVLPLAYLLMVFARERESRMRQSLELGRAYRGTALLLRDLLEEDDEYTGRHTEDVVGLTVSVAERMGLDEDLRRSAELGALLHDIGKIAVPDEIINKPGPLNDEEWAIMKTHTVEGERMLAQVGGLLADVGVVVRASHERWDGGGYPDGLAGEEIPLAACIVSACDAFNAMTTDRSYRKALPLSVAVSELQKNAGTQFCPAVVEALVALVLESAEADEPGFVATVAPEAAPAAPAALPAPRRA